LEEFSDAKHAPGGQRHEDDNDGRYVSGDHLVSVVRSIAKRNGSRSLSRYRQLPPLPLPLLLLLLQYSHQLRRPTAADAFLRRQ